MWIKIDEIKSAYHNKRLLVHTWFDCLEFPQFDGDILTRASGFYRYYKSEAMRSDHRITEKLFSHLIIIVSRTLFFLDLVYVSGQSILVVHSEILYSYKITRKQNKNNRIYISQLLIGKKFIYLFKSLQHVGIYYKQRIKYLLIQK